MAHPFGVVPHPRRPHSASAEWDPAPRDPAGHGVLGRPRKGEGILFEQTSGLDRFGLPSPRWGQAKPFENRAR